MPSLTHKACNTGSKILEHMSRFFQKLVSDRTTALTCLNSPLLYLSDDYSLVNIIAQIAPFDVAAKQALLESQGLAARSEPCSSMVASMGSSLPSSGRPSRSHSILVPNVVIGRLVLFLSCVKPVE